MSPCIVLQIDIWYNILFEIVSVYSIAVFRKKLNAVDLRLLF